MNQREHRMKLIVFYKYTNALFYPKQSTYKRIGEQDRRGIEASNYRRFGK